MRDFKCADVLHVGGRTGLKREVRLPNRTIERVDDGGNDIFERPIPCRFRGRRAAYGLGPSLEPSFECD
jgi:hypothetical protein